MSGRLLVDTNVVNGQRYDYRVRVRYGRELTDGVEVSATPAEPPRAVLPLPKIPQPQQRR